MSPADHPQEDKVIAWTGGPRRVTVTRFEWFLAFVGAVAFSVLFVLLAWVVRDAGIRECRREGGTPITPSWVSTAPWDVVCER